jgi:hypothetical protein
MAAQRRHAALRGGLAGCPPSGLLPLARMPQKRMHTSGFVGNMFITERGSRAKRVGRVESLLQLRVVSFLQAFEKQEHSAR